MIDLSQLYAACVVSHVRSLPLGTFRGPAYLLGKDTQGSFDIPYHDATFSAAYEILEELGILRRHSHPGMMRYYVLEAKDFDSLFASSVAAPTFHIPSYRIGRPIDSPEYKLLETYAEVGQDWLTDALETFREEIWTRLEAEEDDEALPDGSVGAVPASDRLVSRADNVSSILEIDAALKDIGTELRESNEAGLRLGDLRSLAIEEVEDLRSTINRPENRVQALLVRARETLSWLIKKCAETSVSELAKHAMKLFIAWLSP